MGGLGSAVRALHAEATERATTRRRTEAYLAETFQALGDASRKSSYRSPATLLPLTDS